MEERKQAAQRYQYQIPSKLQVEDKVVTLGPLSLTIRQAFILVTGGCLSLNAWRIMTAVMPSGTFSLVIRCLLAALPVCISLFVAMKKIAGRYLEIWFLVVWRYYGLPKVYHWCRIRQREDVVPHPGSRLLLQVIQALRKRAETSFEDESE